MVRVSIVEQTDHFIEPTLIFLLHVNVVVQHIMKWLTIVEIVNQRCLLLQQFLYQQRSCLILFMKAYLRKDENTLGNGL
jgi:hypothetical protein